MVCIMKKLLQIILIFSFILFYRQSSSERVIPNSWVYSTVHVSNLSTGVAGTGFLVTRRTKEKLKKVFLISNKHVLMPHPLKNEAGENKEAKARVILNRTDKNKLKAFVIEVTLRDASGKELCIGHPDKEVDVAALHFTQYITENRKLKPGLKLGFIKERRLATKDILTQQFVSIGDRIVVLGYPLNMVEGRHCIPIARDGVIASQPELDFKSLPIILIDSTMVRGSSGSPVFLPILPYKVTSETKINPIELTQATLLGIVSKLVPDWEMQIKKTITFGKPPQTVSVIDVANIGIIFRAETIIETIDQSGIPSWKADSKQQESDKVQ